VASIPQQNEYSPHATQDTRWRLLHRVLEEETIKLDSHKSTTLSSWSSSSPEFGICSRSAKIP